MKVLLFICGLAALSAGLAVGCGPKHTYCPNQSTGECNFDDAGAPPPEDTSGGGGDTIIIGGDT